MVLVRWRLRRIAVWASLLAAFAASAAAHPADLPLFGDLAPGPHTVGFRVVSALAATSGPWDAARPLEVALWYPAASGSGEPMRFAEYFALSPDLREKSTGAAGSDKAVDKTDLVATLNIAVTGAPDGLPPPLADRLLTATMLARRDAPTAAGRFPLVLWGSRYGTTAAQAVLSEWLASRGFVVAFARPREAGWKMPFELETPEAKATELDFQVRDLRGAMQAVQDRGEVDPERTVLMTWSYAGEAIFVLQRSDPRIRGMVALSTNLLDRWVYAPAEAVAAVTDGPLEVPVLLVSEERNRAGELKTAPPAWPSLPAGSARLIFPSLAHGNFNLLEGMVPGLYGLTKVQPWSRGGVEARVGYEAITRLVELWMRQTLGDAAAARERDALIAALPADFARYEPAPARPRPRPTMTEVSFASADGLVVGAALYRPPPETPTRGCVLLAHQSGSSRGEYAAIAPALARRGFTALAVDLRWGRRDRFAGQWNETARRAGAIGRLEGGDRPAFADLLEGAAADLAAAQSYLSGQGCGNGVVLWGSSFSANAVLERAVAAPRDVRAVISFSPGEYDAKRPEHMQTLVRSLSVPVLIVWGSEEAEVGAPRILDAVPGVKASHASSTGYHGSSILFQDTLAWTALWRFLDGFSPASP